MLKGLLALNGVVVLTESRLTGAAGDNYIIQTPDGEKAVSADSVICAIGYDPDNALYDSVKGQVPYARLLGDARSVNNIMYAIWDAYELARGI
jgi:2-enoate reductase